MFLVKLLVALVLFIPSTSWAQATFFANGNGGCQNNGLCGGAGLTLTYAVDLTGIGANGQLAVWAWASCSGGNTASAISGATYAGTSLTLQDSSNPAADYTGSWWTWPIGSTPTTGNNNVVITYATAIDSSCGGVGSKRFGSGAIAATGVNQTTTLSSKNKANGTSTAPSVTISTSNANDLGIYATCSGDTLTGTSTGTQKWLRTDTSEACGSDLGAIATGSTVTFTDASSSSDNYIMFGAAFNGNLGGGGPDVTPFYKRRVQ